MTEPDDPNLPEYLPFTHNVAAILRYPLQLSALSSVAGFAVFSAVGIIPTMGVVLLLMLWAAAFRYAIEVLERTAHGHLDPPELALDAGGADGRQMLLVQLLFALAAYGAMLIDHLAVRWLLLCGLGLVQPAATVTLALAGNLESTFNPFVWTRIATRMGASYALLVAFPLLTGWMQDVVNPWLAGAIPMLFALVISGFVAFYLLILQFHLIGYLMYQYRERLGWTPQWLAPLKLEDRHAPFMQRIEHLLAEGYRTEAIAAFEPYLRGAMHSTPAMHQRFRALLTEAGDTAALLRHSDLWLGQLLGENDHRQALALLRESLAMDQAWRPTAAEHCVALAEAAERLGQLSTALMLLRDFHRRFPKRAEAVTHALHAAHLLSDRLGDTDAAREQLNELSAQYAQHPQHDEIAAQLAKLDAAPNRV